jgi:hypothetical protein
MKRLIFNTNNGKNEIMRGELCFYSLKKMTTISYNKNNTFRVHGWNDGTIVLARWFGTMVYPLERSRVVIFGKGRIDLKSNESNLNYWGFIHAVVRFFGCTDLL